MGEGKISRENGEGGDDLLQRSRLYLSKRGISTVGNLCAEKRKAKGWRAKRIYISFRMILSNCILSAQKEMELSILALSHPFLFIYFIFFHNRICPWFLLLLHGLRCKKFLVSYARPTEMTNKDPPVMTWISPNFLKSLALHPRKKKEGWIKKLSVGG